MPSGARNPVLFLGQGVTQPPEPDTPTVEDSGIGGAALPKYALRIKAANGLMVKRGRARRPPQARQTSTRMYRTGTLRRSKPQKSADMSSAVSVGVCLA